MQRARIFRQFPGRLAILLLFALPNSAHALDTNLILEIAQAPDIGCDDAPDELFTTELITVAPGNNCVHYRLTATNIGLKTAYNVVVSDLTPAFTTYQKFLRCSAPDCRITEPEIGASGRVAGEVSQLESGAALEIIFAVKLE
ncbi:MAG: DUF11 domain-containing protein [Gammaproteobacteria bacterium]|nr:DUF11 domain-containing protein [Gammaproteobacteria bacterium]